MKFIRIWRDREKYLDYEGSVALLGTTYIFTGVKNGGVTRVNMKAAPGRGLKISAWCTVLENDLLSYF